MKQWALKYLFLVISFFLSHNSIQAQILPSKAADLIVFSFNRPIQLYATLESITKYISHLNQMYVLYRASSEQYEQAYQEIHQRFPHIILVKQGPNPRQDFKPLLLQCFDGSPVEYIMFAVDDDIVKDFIDITHCVEALEKYNAHGFYLRLGVNITKGYTGDVVFQIPSPLYVENDMVRFSFKEGIADWAYPHNLDMTLFKKAHIESFLKNHSYSSPNTLESAWAIAADLNVYGLCYRTSKKFVLPLNIVQKDWWVPNENSFSIEELLIKWQQGLAIDISQFDRVNNNCVLMGYQPTFIPRI